jgi:ribosome maturation factor RimP
LSPFFISGLAREPRQWRTEMAGVSAGLYDGIERTVEGLGYELVDVERLAAGLVRVTLDSADGIKLEDCERVSRQLSHWLAVEGVDYERLEVSSPGLDRPLKRARDFGRFIGAEIQVQLATPVLVVGSSTGRKRMRGRLLGVDGDAGRERVRIELTPDDAAAAPAGKRAAPKARKAVVGEQEPATVVEFALSDVDKARLIPELNFRGGSKERGRDES